MPLLSSRSRTSRLASLLCLTALLGACGGGGSGADAVAGPAPEPAPAETGELVLAITDAEGDFLRYAVDLEAIVLERRNGDRVEALPNRTRIDFVELVEVTELLSVATVPAGRYDAVTLTLDFSGADVLVQGADGSGLPANLVDDDGAPLELLDVRLTLPEQDVITIAPGVPAAFSLDFDLAASNEIDLSVDPPVVTVAPVLLAVPELETERTHRVRGLLEAVDPAAQEVTLDVRPFRTTNRRFGTFTFAVDDETAWDVDGEGLVGDAGLEALASLPADTPVVASGVVADGALVADRVVAGSSVPWADADALQGVVVARSDDTLTVAGTRVLRDGEPERWRETWTLRLGPDTAVSAPGVPAADLGPERVSVGQRVVASGSWVDDATLDATEGRVRLQRSSLVGTVTGTAPLVVDLALLNGRRPERFDFTGTGTPDADPDAYGIDTGTLPLPALETGDVVRVRGLVTAFGAAPPAFEARSVQLVAEASRSAALAARWPDGTDRPFAALAPDRLLVDLAEAAFRYRVGPLSGFGAERPVEFPLVAPELPGAYVVRVRGEGELLLFRDFADLADAAGEELAAGRVLTRLYAAGRAPAAEGGLVTRRAVLEFREPAP
jgi:hypothetical protein